MSNLKKIAALIAVLAAIYALRAKPKEGKVVQTASGPVKGIISVSRDGREFYEWLGIPYAKPPIGQLRFESPQPIDPWETIKEATSYGPWCAQVCLLALVELGNEDCLTINVHVPKVDAGASKKLLPIMLYIHGGAFMFSNSMINRPDYFMDHDVIMVTFNYRLGPFGFLSTGDESIRGNMGMKDQVLAIKWIHANAKAFGGDPSRITLMGDSSGAISADYHMISSQTKGLINKVIALSGAVGSSWSFTEPETVIAKDRQIAASLNCSEEDPAKMTTCLKQVSTSELLNSIRVDIRDNFLFYPQRSGYMFSPTIESTNSADAFLTEHPLHILRKGEAQRMPMLTGVVADEGLLAAWSFFTDEKNLNNFEANFEERVINACGLKQMGNKTVVAEGIRSYYFPPTVTMTYEEKLEAFVNLFGDCFFNLPALVRADIQRRHSNVYLYYFNIQGGPSMTQLLMSHRDTEIFGPLIDTALSFVKMYAKDKLFGMPREQMGISHGDDSLLAFPVLFTIGKHHTFYDLSKKWVKFLVDFATQEDTYLKPVAKDGPLKYLEINKGGKVTSPEFATRLEFLRSVGMN